MTLQCSTTYRNALLDQFETTVGVSAVVDIYTGSEPANCAAAATGTKLASITLPSDWMSNASSGSKTLLGSWTATASNTGTAGYFRLLDSTDTTTHMQGNITATGGGGDMTVDNTSIANGQTVTVTTFTLTAPNA